MLDSGVGGGCYQLSRAVKMFSFKHVEVFVPLELQCTFWENSGHLERYLAYSCNAGHRGRLRDFMLPGKVFADFWYLRY